MVVVRLTYFIFSRSRLLLNKYDDDTNSYSKPTTEEKKLFVFVYYFNRSVSKKIIVSSSVSRFCLICIEKKKINNLTSYEHLCTSSQ